MGTRIRNQKWGLRKAYEAETWTFRIPTQPQKKAVIQAFTRYVSRLETNTSGFEPYFIVRIVGKRARHTTSGSILSACALAAELLEGGGSE